MYMNNCYSVVLASCHLSPQSMSVISTITSIIFRINIVCDIMNLYVWLIQTIRIYLLVNLKTDLIRQNIYLFNDLLYLIYIPTYLYIMQVV